MVATIIAALVGAASADAAPCVPRARLDGDAAAVASVATELGRLGVAVTNDQAARAARTSEQLASAAGSSTCPVVVAAVELDRGGGIAVAVRDGAQRSEGRVVSDAALAAAWIDSWLRDDFTAPAASAPPELAPPGVQPAREGVEARAPSAPLVERLSIAATFDQAWTDDRSRWTGLGVGGCMRAGALCLGGRVRYATQDLVANETAATRHDISVLATASVSRELGRMVVSPEVGLGVGRLSTSRLEGCKPPPCDPMDPVCANQPPPPCGTSNTDAAGAVQVGDGFSTATWTPRAAATFRIALPVFEHVWLDGIAAVALAPFGHGDPYVPASSTIPPGVPPELLALPGEPVATFQLGVGLRVGVP